MRKLICIALLGVAGVLFSGQVARSNLNITLKPTQDGWWTRYRNFAAEEWRTDMPERGKDWKIVAEYPGEKHQFVFYYEGRFRSPSGGVQGTPLRWAYLRLQEDRWNGQAWVLPDGTASMPGKIPLDGTVLQLMQSYSKGEIMDAMDKYVGIDGVGAPE